MLNQNYLSEDIQSFVLNIKKETQVLLVTKLEVSKFVKKLTKILETKKVKNVNETLKVNLKRLILKKNEEYLKVFNQMKEQQPKLVAMTVKRYEKGGLAQIFNKEEMESLADEVVLKVLARYRKGKVNLAGLDSYFKQSFKNQTLKKYEAYAKTDIRGSITTVGSDEAMALAASKNLHSPENQYVVDNTMKKAFKLLQRVDFDFNNGVQKYNNSIATKQYYYLIVKNLVDGFTENEICEQLKIDRSEYRRQKRLAFECLKKNMFEELKSLFSVFEVAEDRRIYSQNVHKRSRKSSEVDLFVNKISYVIHETPISEKQIKISLVARIDVVDRFGEVILTPKDLNFKNGFVIDMASEVCNLKDKDKVKNNISLSRLSLSKENTFVIKSENFLESFKFEIRNYKKKQPSAA